MQAVLYLHVPALHHTGQLHRILEQLKDDTLLTLGLEGTLGDLVGDFLLLKNRYTLGITEEGILYSLQLAAAQVVNAERALREKMRDDAHLKDLVSRAYGLLVHSYHLETKEALNAISALKLGMDLGWIRGISSQTLQTLFFQCRRAHRAHLLREKTFHPDLAHQRAEFVHRSLHGIELNE